MQINITGHGVEVTPALKHLTEDKFSKLERHFDRILSTHVVFEVEKLNHIAKATVALSGGEIHAHSASDDMYTSIDDLVKKLDHQLVKFKEKLKDHRD